MTLPWRISLLYSCILILSWHTIVVDAAANFLDVRTKSDIDRSKKVGVPSDKYFHESIFDPHYDGRFAQRRLLEEEKLPDLTALIQSFMETMSDIGAETWIMHGTLLGWWWNQKILPWDSDVDVQVSERTIHFLAKYYNMTEYHFRFPGIKQGRTYLLEINPHFKVRGTEDKHNAIDARWIDTDSGLFIDITTVRIDHAKRVQGVEGALMCKDRHHYLERDIFPLRDTFFEGVHAKVPFEYVALLEEEYGPVALKAKTYQRHKFDDLKKIWEKLPQPATPVKAPTAPTVVTPIGQGH